MALPKGTALAGRDLSEQMVCILGSNLCQVRVHVIHATEIVWKSLQSDGEGRSLGDAFLFTEIY